MTSYLSLSPRDPIVARDGRPFNAGGGNRMRSLEWIYPQLASGSFRSMLGKLDGADFGNPAFRDQLKAVNVAGPFPEWNGELYFPVRATWS